MPATLTSLENIPWSEFREHPTKPGVFVGEGAEKCLPTIALARLAKRADGAYNVEVVIAPVLWRVAKRGVTVGGHHYTMRQLKTLVASGLVKGSRPTPRQWLFDVVDLIRHERETGRDRNFWNQERRDRYAAAYHYTAPNDDDAEDAE